MKFKYSKSAVICSSLILCVMGLAAFFLPEELLAWLGDKDTTSLPLQLYGASLLGFGFANWHIRNSPVGGIYGRAIVTGNIIHLLSAVGILLGLLLGGQSEPVIIAVFSIYAFLTILFIFLLFSDGLSKE